MAGWSEKVDIQDSGHELIRFDAIRHGSWPREFVYWKCDVQTIRIKRRFERLTRAKFGSVQIALDASVSETNSISEPNIADIHIIENMAGVTMEE